jgi:hypothetical protein
LRLSGSNVGAVRILRASLWAAVIAVACGPIDQSGGIGAGGTGGSDAGVGGASPPAIDVRIVSPADGEKCNADDQGSCGISVAVSGATVAAPGRCDGAQGCGHIDLYIDGTACGTPNVQSSSDNLTASFGRCGKVEGKHTLMVELRSDGGALLARSQVVHIDVKKEKHHGGDDDHGHGGGDDDDGHD